MNAHFSKWRFFFILYFFIASAFYDQLTLFFRISLLIANIIGQHSAIRSLLDHCRLLVAGLVNSWNLEHQFMIYLYSLKCVLTFSFEIYQWSFLQLVGSGSCRTFQSSCILMCITGRLNYLRPLKSQLWDFTPENFRFLLRVSNLYS